MNRVAGWVLAISLALASPATFARGAGAGAQGHAYSGGHPHWGAVLLLLLLMEADDLRTGAFAPTNPVAAAAAEFMRFNPCPSTGATAGTCPGYVIVPVDPRRPVVAAYDLLWETEASARARGFLPY